MRRIGIIILLGIISGACTPIPDANAPLPTMLLLPTQPPPTPTSISLLDQQASPLDYNLAVSGQLGSAQQDIWAFDAQAGDSVQIRTISAVPLQLTLYTATGQHITSGTASISAVIPTSGLYRLTVTNGTDPITYELGLTSALRPAAAPPTLTPIPVVVGVPTPTPALISSGIFMAVLTSGQTAPGTFEMASAPHVYSFEGALGQYIRLYMTPVSGAARPRLSLISPTGEILASDMGSDNGSSARLLNIPVTQTGTYTVQLDSAGNPGTYTLRLDLTDAPIPITPTVLVSPTAPPETPVLTPDYPQAERGVRLSPNVPAQAEIRRASDLNTHSLYAYQGDSLSVGVAPLANSALIPQIELMDPEGNLVGTAVGSSTGPDRDAVISGQVAPYEGPYTLYVTGQNGSTGAYLVSFGYESTRFDVMRGLLLPDSPAFGVFDRRAVADVWHMYLNAGDIVSAAVQPLDGVITPILELVGPHGDLLGLDRDSGGERAPQISGVRAVSSGYHYWRIRPADAAQTGAYQIVWRYLDVAPTPTPPPGTFPLAVITDTVAPGEYDFIPFYGQAGQRVRIYVNAPIGGTLDPVAALIAPSGVSIGSSDDIDDSLNAFFEAQLPEDGTYQVRINGYLSGGDYTLYVERVFAP
jgi:hypothetical protein